MTDGRRDYAVLISLMMREEAEIVAGALRADGIDAFIGNSNHAYTEWLLTPAFGGLQIMTPRSLLAEARTLLSERIRDNADGAATDRLTRNDHWKLWVGIGCLLLPWLAYMAIGQVVSLTDWLYSSSLP
ncbi:MAG TPA: hypothetical protein VIA80_12250 [Hyphomonadaceae bacterium]|jgi:hypothetical protein